MRGGGEGVDDDGATAVCGIDDAGRKGGGEIGSEGRSWYIWEQMADREERLSSFVSNANRTRMTSRGYVMKTEVMPASEPLSKRRSGVS